MNPSVDVPLKTVKNGERMFPGIYKTMDRLVDAKADGTILWPDYCKLPISAALTALVEGYGLSPVAAAMHASRLTAAWTWDKRRIIYNYDAALSATLADQAEDMAETDVLPTELLLHLPYPCVYIRPNLWDDVDGVWVWIEYDTHRRAPELRVQYLFGDGQSIPGVMHLVPGGTIADCIRDTDAETAQRTDMETAMLRSSDNPLVQTLLVVIQLVLYLVADNADVTMRTPPRLARRKDKSKGGKGKGSGKRSAPEQPIQRGDVGVRIGAAIRRQETARPTPTGGTGTGSPKRPHTRRGHWHHYWVGPHDSPERRLVLRWTAPTLIHPEDGGEAVTVYPVR